MQRSNLIKLAVISLLAFIAFAGPLLADVEGVFDQLLGATKGGDAYVRVITDNPTAWHARWHMMENAKKTIDTTYFIVETDIFGRSLVGLLLKKAKEGVKIRIMVDARGTKSLARMTLGRDLLQELMQHEGVTIKVYNPLHKGLLALHKDIRNPIASNHDKLIIADGEWVITGGRNISANYFVASADKAKAYRDTDVLIRGAQVAAQAQEAFELEFDQLRNADVHKDFFGNWDSQNLQLEVDRRVMQSFLLGNLSGDSSGLSKNLRGVYDSAVEELKKYPSIQGYSAFRPFQGERPYPTMILDKSSLIGGMNNITPNMIRFFDTAQKEIVIQNPYVVLTKTAKAALVRAAGRGVDIILVTNSPDSTDSLLTQAMFVQEWKQIMKAVPTMKIFAFKGPGKLHAKVFVIDRKITGIGTYNMDPMSEKINSEEIAIVKSAAFGQQNYLRIKGDTKNSVEYKIKIDVNGDPQQVVGPSDHVQDAALKAVERVQVMSFLRPII